MIWQILAIAAALDARSGSVVYSDLGPLGPAGANGGGSPMDSESTSTQASPQGPLTLRQLGQEFREEVLSLDRGLAGTFLALWRAPADVARGYVARRDPRYVRPLRYLMIAVTVNIALAWLWLERDAAAGSERARATFLLEHSVLLLFVVVPVLALLMRVLLGRLQVSLLDAFVVLGYTQAQVTWIASLATLATGAGPAWLPQALSLGAAAYLVWAWASFARGATWARWCAALAMLVLGQVANDLIVLAALRLVGA